jgi:hypothetical protein
MKGKDYVATTQLTDRAGAVLADVDKSCERVPASSLGWLLEQGLIKPADKRTARVAPAETE